MRRYGEAKARHEVVDVEEVEEVDVFAPECFAPDFLSPDFAGAGFFGLACVVGPVVQGYGFQGSGCVFVTTSAGMVVVVVVVDPDGAALAVFDACAPEAVTVSCGPATSSVTVCAFSPETSV
jgi:hypothetical protein